LVILSEARSNSLRRWVMENLKEKVQGKGPRERRDSIKRITTIGWGLFFIWLGFVLMIKAGSGLILLGVGLISLGMQVARKYSGLDSDGFWIVVGILFVIVGTWEMFEIKMPLMSVFLIVIGGAFLVSTLKGKGRV
jgi:hypothetical protein